MANQDLPHTRPVLCGTLYYCTTGCVVQCSIPAVQQCRCRVGVQCGVWYYLSTVYSIVVWYSIVHGMYVYTISIVYSIVHSMYVSLCVLLLCQCCCMRERLSLARQQPACLVPLPYLPTHCVYYPRLPSAVTCWSWCVYSIVCMY